MTISVALEAFAFPKAIFPVIPAFLKVICSSDIWSPSGAEVFLSVGHYRSNKQLFNIFIGIQKAIASILSENIPKRQKKFEVFGLHSENFYYLCG